MRISMTKDRATKSPLLDVWHAYLSICVALLVSIGVLAAGTYFLHLEDMPKALSVVGFVALVIACCPLYLFLYETIYRVLNRAVRRKYQSEVNAILSNFRRTGDWEKLYLRLSNMRAKPRLANDRGRHRLIVASALFHLGRPEEAVASLENMPSFDDAKFARGNSALLDAARKNKKAERKAGGTRNKTASGPWELDLMQLLAAQSRGYIAEGHAPAADSCNADAREQERVLWPYLGNPAFKEAFQTEDPYEV